MGPMLNIWSIVLLKHQTKCGIVICYDRFIKYFIVGFFSQKISCEVIKNDTLSFHVTVHRKAVND